jgi:hypothetical protein
MRKYRRDLIDFVSSCRVKTTLYQFTLIMRQIWVGAQSFDKLRNSVHARQLNGQMLHTSGVETPASQLKSSNEDCSLVHFNGLELLVRGFQPLAGMAKIQDLVKALALN